MKTLRSFVLSLVIVLSAIAPSCVAYAQGTTVFGGLGPGLGGSVNPFDSDFQAKQKIAELVRQADKANSDAAAAYLRVAQDWLTNAVMARDAGRPISPIIDPPLVIHVDPKTGVATNGPDAVAQKPVLPAPTGTLGSNGAIKNDSPPADRIDQLLAQNTYLYNLLARMQADLTAIKTKLGVQ